MTSPPLLAELGRVLRTSTDGSRRSARMRSLRSRGSRSWFGRRNGVEVVLDDPDDDRVLEAAAAGRADVIVSGDRHLLRLRSWNGIQIENAAAFSKRLDQR